MADDWLDKVLDTERQTDVFHYNEKLSLRYRPSYANTVMAKIHVKNVSPYDRSFAFEDADHPIPADQRTVFDIPAGGTRVVFVKKCRRLRYFWRKK